MDPQAFPLALTFDDVLLLPQHSNVMPSEVSVDATLGAGISLRIPLVSSAMDTVTEARLAIAMARAGGLGVIHKNLSVEAQAREVLRVKKSESGMIVEPVVIHPDRALAEARELMLRHEISGIPVVDAAHKLVGILTNRDLRFAKNLHLPVQTAMTREVVTAPEGIDLESAKALLQEHRIEKLPVVDGSGRLKGLITIKDIEKSARYPNATKDERGRLRVGAAVGVSTDRKARVAALMEAGADVLFIDTAHGHTQSVAEAVRATRAEWPHVPIAAGNVATAAGVEHLLDAGADIVKVGIGPGSICTTRIVAGVGVPQLSAVIECAAAATRRGACTIADGGIRYSGDVVKALAAGASCVMVGSLLAGTDEAPGEVILYQGRSYKAYRGMGSLGAMQAGSADRYFQAGTDEPRKLVPEGVEGMVPYKGSVEQTLFQLVGGLRAGMGYLGAATLPALHERARFVRITSAGMRESHAHDITVAIEAPNYRSSA